MHFVFQECVDTTLETLSGFENLKVLSIINCKVIPTSVDYFENFCNLESLLLWQCHPRVFKCARKSRNLGFTCELSPLSPLRHHICLKSVDIETFRIVYS